MWVSGTIKPLYKNKGDKFNPNKYRPITIVSCFGKLYSSKIETHSEILGRYRNKQISSKAMFN
jgi:hypothetical protein